MATGTETGESVVTGGATGNWKAGLLGGLGGGVVFAAALTVLAPDVLAVAIPSLYGLAPPPNGLAGWVVHLSHGAVLGVVYAALVGAAGYSGASSRLQVSLGVGYGIVLWLVLAALVMPAWLSAVGSPANPPLPNFDQTSLLGHALYGAVLGSLYFALEEL
jgi:hypothetical protein